MGARCGMPFSYLHTTSHVDAKKVPFFSCRRYSNQSGLWHSGAYFECILTQHLLVFFYQRHWL